MARGSNAYSAPLAAWRSSDPALARTSRPQRCDTSSSRNGRRPRTMCSGGAQSWACVFRLKNARAWQISWRLWPVAHDTSLCLWDRSLTEAACTVDRYAGDVIRERWRPLAIVTGAAGERICPITFLRSIRARPRRAQSYSIPASRRWRLRSRNFPSSIRLPVWSNTIPRTFGRRRLRPCARRSRTLLMDIRAGSWDAELCELFGVPPALLPPIGDCAGEFGTTDLFGGQIRILGIAGDQQAATVGQSCFSPGMVKSTYGTGCFALLNTGDQPIVSKNRLLTTIAYQLEGKRTYALEGAIFIAGAAVQWLRDELRLIAAAPEVNALAAAADPADEVYFVPAFVGLGAPWWDAQARGAIYGLTRKSGTPELARAILEAVGYQTRDLLEAMHADWPAAGATSVLRVDGGMAASDMAMQFVADILATPVERPLVMETTALGAAYLAGRAADLCPDLPSFAAMWKRAQRFEPRMDAATRERKWSGWRDAVARTLSQA